MADGRMWSVRDRYGNDVYLTEERWQHITEPINHPDMVHFMAELQEDEISDTLTISFFPGESATGIERNDNLLLRINKQKQYAVSLSIFNYSILAQKTEAGLRSLPLIGLQELSDALRETVLAILLKKPLSSILAVSTYTPSLSESVLIATIHDAALLAPV